MFPKEIPNKKNITQPRNDIQFGHASQRDITEDILHSPFGDDIRSLLISKQTDYMAYYKI